jgi:hypothetical protein
MPKEKIVKITQTTLSGEEQTVVCVLEQPGSGGDFFTLAEEISKITGVKEGEVKVLKLNPESIGYDIATDTCITYPAITAGRMEFVEGRFLMWHVDLFTPVDQPNALTSWPDVTNHIAPIELPEDVTFNTLVKVIFKSNPPTLPF